MDGAPTISHAVPETAFATYEGTLPKCLLSYWSCMPIGLKPGDVIRVRTNLGLIVAKRTLGKPTTDKQRVIQTLF
jgi:hypothetical protein